jgi:hypothetical protein
MSLYRKAMWHMDRDIDENRRRAINPSTVTMFGIASDSLAGMEFDSATPTTKTEELSRSTSDASSNLTRRFQTSNHNQALCAVVLMYR